MASDRSESLRHRGVPGAPSPFAVVAKRQAIIRADYVGLVDDALIIADRAREWGITRRQVKRYLAVVKTKYARAQRDDAAADFLHQLEGTVVANIGRARDTERRAREAADACEDPRDRASLFRAEAAAQAQELRGVERLCAMRGLDAAKRIEISKADPVAAMSPEERRTRALRHARKLTETSATKGEA